MKRALLVVVVMMLAPGCFSKRHVNHGPTEIAVGETYHVHSGGERYRIKVTGVDFERIEGTRGSEELSFLWKDVEYVTKVDFYPGKTIGLVSAIVLPIVALCVYINVFFTCGT